MGPAHSCDYVDIFMGELDRSLVNTSPVPLVLTLLPTEDREMHQQLDWSRFRDDGFTILLHPDHAAKFESHLQSLHSPDIRWTVTTGREVTYLDVRLSMTKGGITTDVFSKNCHSYLPPYSCHSPAVFKGLISAVGTRLRMLCSEADTLEKRIEEYTKYFAMAGWDGSRAKRELRKGANKDRRDLLTKPTKKKKKLAWVTTYDPRLPSKSEIIRKNLPLLYTNPENKNVFPRKTIIAADRRRKNLAEIYKPTVPKRFVQHGPRNKSGFFTCSAKRCDTCSHSEETYSMKSPLGREDLED